VTTPDIGPGDGSASREPPRHPLHPAAPLSREAQNNAIYTQVSIEQLKAVHGKTHPAETGKRA